MAESNSFYQSPNLDLSGPGSGQGGSNQQSQLDQEKMEYDALLAQFSADGVITDEERSILGGLGLGGAAFAAQTGRAPALIPQGNVSTFAQRVAANDAARLAAQNRPVLIGTGASTSGVTNPRLVPGTNIVLTGQPPAVTSTGGPPARTSSPTRLSADDFDFKIGGNKPKSGFKIPTAVSGLASNVVKGGVVTSLLTPNEMGRAEVFPTGASATLFEDAEGNISLVPKEGFSPMTGDNLDRREPAVTTAADKNGFFSPGGFGYEYLGPRLGENIGKFAGEQKYGTGITAEGQATGFPVDRPSLAGDLLTLPGTALNVVGDFVTDPFIVGGELAKDAASYVTGASGVQAQQAAQFAQDLEAVPTINPFTGQTIENPIPFDFNNDPSAGMTMNQQAIANALAGTSAQSQEEGQVRAAPPAQTLSQFMRYEDSPEQRTEQFVDEQGRLRLRPTSEAAQLRGLSDFVQPSLDEREMRLAERDRLPGETQTERDTRIAQSRTTGARTEGMSFDDARRRAEGELAARGVRGKDGGPPDAFQVNDLARSIQAQEPERLEALRIKRAKDLAKLNFEPKVVEVEGQKLIQLAPEYYQPVRAEPKEDEPFEPRILDHNNFIYFEIAPNRFERQPATGQTKGDILAEIKRINEVMGATPAEGADASDVKSYATEAEAKASGVKGEVLIGGRRAVIE